MTDEKEQTDPCKDFGPVQRLAVVWFVAVLIIGTAMLCNFIRIDRWMYTNNAEILDYQAYKENRRGFNTLASERVDPRQVSNLTAVRERLAPATRTTNH